MIANTRITGSRAITYGSQRADLPDFDLVLDVMGVIPWKVLQPQEGGRVISIMGEAPDGVSAERGGGLVLRTENASTPTGASVIDHKYPGDETADDYN